jgi:cobyrinic acid a,c-diamide synthase
MAHLFISAAHKSSGKTTLTTGLAAAFSRRGLTVQTFKKGPDYIDPMWLGRASGRPCLNLDFHTMSAAEIQGTFSARSHDADIALIEGNKGLFDGLDHEGRDSNAALAGLLDAPVILVIDTRGMTRGIAPLVLGYQSFDSGVRIAGVILNKVGGPRHEGKLRTALEYYTDIPVLGAVTRSPDLEIPERHLGLTPANEVVRVTETIDRLAAAVESQVELAPLLEAAEAVETPCAAFARPLPRRRAADIRIGVAQDAAFGFYYPDDLEALAAAGAELVPIDTLRDAHLPAVDGLFIGGGFPETRMAALEANVSLRSEIGSAVAAGMPAYAECGGLLYMARSLRWGDERRQMVGVIPADAVIHERPQGRGYMWLEETGRHPWPNLSPPDPAPAPFPAHEFHYAALENLARDSVFAYRVKRGAGIGRRHDGIVVGNLLASFCHLRDMEGNRWAARFAAFVRASARGTVTRAVRVADGA